MGDRKPTNIVKFIDRHRENIITNSIVLVTPEFRIQSQSWQNDESWGHRLEIWIQDSDSGSTRCKI